MVAIIGKQYRSRPELEEMIRSAVTQYNVLQKICMAMLSTLNEINKVASINAGRMLQAPDLTEAWKTVKSMTDEHAETMRSKEEYESRSDKAGLIVPARKS